MSYNGLSLNNPADSDLSSYEINTVVGQTSMDYTSEVNQQRDGLEVYPFRKVSRMVTLNGTIRATSQANLYDLIKALANAFDPVKIAHDNAADPFIAFDFSSPTADTANYATGYVPSRYYAVPLRIPDPVINYAVGDTAYFDATLLLRDPRRYLQTATTQTGAGTIANSLADYMSPATLTITMSGAGSATYSVTNTTTKDGAVALVLDLSGLSNGDVVVVDMDHRSITLNGASASSRYVSGNYFHIDVGNNVIAYANTSNASSVLSFRRAFSI